MRVCVQVCLFGAAETSLRDALRGGASDDELALLVRAALRRKLPQHAGECPRLLHVTIPMLPISVSRQNIT